MIYAFRMKCGLVKIGWSSNPVKRLGSLSSTFRENLEPLGVMDGMMAEETALHRKFSANWVAGEWFALTDEQIASIGLGPFPPYEPVRATPHLRGRPIFPGAHVLRAREGGSAEAWETWKRKRGGRQPKEASLHQRWHWGRIGEKGKEIWDVHFV